MKHRYEHIGNINRLRITENTEARLRLQRFEKSDSWDYKFLEKLYSNFPENILQRYPDPTEFLRELSVFIGVASTKLSVTSGIDEAIRNLIFLFCDEKRPFFTNAPAYAMYQVYADILKVKCHKIQPDPRSFLTPDVLVKEFPKNMAVAFIANPSQPVENTYDLSELKFLAEHCRKQGAILAVDEAYHFFGSVSALQLIDEFENVLVLRSFSKAFGAASIRLGYVAGSNFNIRRLQGFRLAHESNSFSYYIARTLIRNFDTVIKPNIDSIIKGRDFFRGYCNKIGFNAWGNFANFVLIDAGTKERMEKIVDRLEDERIFVKSHYPKPLSSYITVTSGPIEAMELVGSLIESS